ncbi:MAG: hypothetical protein OXN89_10690, partial [Bryobacterales bacterium]|nr:hypothetical protein [Bryobacterales bacterium]
TVTVAISGHSGTDLTLDTASLTFSTSTWDTAQTVTVSAGQDDDTSNDSATLTHTASGGGYSLTATLAVTVTDTTVGGVSLSLSPTSVSEDAEPTNITLTATRSETGGGRAIDVPVSVTGGTAQAGTDYVEIFPLTIRIAAGQPAGSEDITFEPIDDEDAESDETVVFATGGDDFRTASARLTIRDDDRVDSKGSETPSLTLWTERLAYPPHEPVRLWLDIDPRGDDRTYTVFLYLESVETGVRHYIAPQTASMQLRGAVVDQYGAGREAWRARSLRRIERELAWEGQVPHAGLWHFAAELRSPGSAQALKRAYAKFVVPRRGLRLINTPGTVRAFTEDAQWTSDWVYILRDQLVVKSGATLTVEAGTLIQAWGRSAGIVVEPGGRLRVRGRRESPVVMTCLAPVGERFPGCWGGLKLFGHKEGDGHPPPQRYALLSGDSSPLGINGEDSGIELRFLRVEFAGAQTAPGEHRAAFELVDSGSQAAIDHVQVHASAGDGFAFRGGAAHCDHCVVSEARGSSLTWSQGWQGSAQFLYVQQGSRAHSAIRGSATTSEQSAGGPEFMNSTLVGGYNLNVIGGSPGTSTSIGPAILLQGDAAIRMGNLIAVGFAGFAIDGTSNSFAEGRSSLEDAILHTNAIRHITRGQVTEEYSPHVSFLERDPYLLNIRYEANPDPRPKSGSAALRLGNAIVPPFAPVYSRAGHFLGAFRKVNWLEEWTFFGPERDYETPDE